MEKRYSEMSEFELKKEIADLKMKAQKAEQMGMVSEFAVYERKNALAKCYLLNPSDYTSGEQYDVEGDPGTTFKIVYLNGIFAWGYKNNQQEMEAVPISVLIRK